MKAVYFALALLAALLPALSSAGSVGAAEPAGFHTSKSTVLSVDVVSGQVRLIEEGVGPLVLSLAPQTGIVDEMGSPIAAAALRAGDLVREECQFAKDGKRVARQIRLLRPAWMETASPEQ